MNYFKCKGFRIKISIKLFDVKVLLVRSMRKKRKKIKMQGDTKKAPVKDEGNLSVFTTE